MIEINKIPFREDLIKAKTKIERFLRFHDLSLKLEKSALDEFNHVINGQLQVFIEEEYQYSIEEAVKAFLFLEDKTSKGCSNKLDYTYRLGELAKSYLLIAIHNAVFWDRGTLNQVYEAPEKYDLFFNTPYWERVSSTNKQIVDALTNGDWSRFSATDGYYTPYTPETMRNDGEHYFILDNGEYVIMNSSEEEFMNEVALDEVVRERVFDTDLVLKSLKFSFLKDNAVLPTIFDGLKKNKFIAEEVEFDSFITIFLGDSLIQKVDWKGTANQLGYFIREMERKSLIYNHKIWETAKACFTIKGGKPLGKIQQNTEKFILKLKDTLQPLKSARKRVAILDAILKSCE